MIISNTLENVTTIKIIKKLINFHEVYVNSIQTKYHVFIF